MAIPDRAVYPTQRQPLQNQISRLLKAAHVDPIQGDIQAVIVPDANLLSGGQVAAEVYAHLQGRTYDTVILIAPSHMGPFRRMNICSIDQYRTPLGDIPVSDRVRNELCDEDDDIYLDDQGHYHVEGVDVQLPFLQAVLGSFDIVPIVMGNEAPEFCRELGYAVGEVMYNRRTLVVACADVVEASEETLDQFQHNFEARDVSRLMTLLNSEAVRIEGKGAVLVALIAALHRRANCARLLRKQLPQGGDPGFIGGVLCRE